MPSPLQPIEFPPDDPDRTRSFRTGVLGVELVGREVIHPGVRWAVCRDSEGSPFGLTAAAL